MTIYQSKRQISIARNHVPARNVTSRSGAIVRGKFPSLKTNRLVGHEERLEGDALVLFEMSPAIASYREQPERVYIPLDQNSSIYTPDFELLPFDGLSDPILIEVKPARQLIRPDVASRLKCIEEHMERQGRPFLILTDEVIRQEPRLTNLKLLCRRLPTRLMPPVDIRQVLRNLPAEGICTLGECVKRVGWAAIVSLMAKGFAQAPLDVAINAETNVAISRSVQRDWFLMHPSHGL